MSTREKKKLNRDVGLALLKLSSCCIEQATSNYYYYRFTLHTVIVLSFNFFETKDEPFFILNG